MSDVELEIVCEGLANFFMNKFVFGKKNKKKTKKQKNKKTKKQKNSNILHFDSHLSKLKIITKIATFSHCILSYHQKDLFHSSPRVLFHVDFQKILKKTTTC
jgi:hypothetical protein